jgi:hypothetical protein
MEIIQKVVITKNNAGMPTSINFSNVSRINFWVISSLNSDDAALVEAVETAASVGTALSCVDAAALLENMRLLGGNNGCSDDCCFCFDWRTRDDVVQEGGAKPLTTVKEVKVEQPIIKRTAAAKPQRPG